MPSIMQDIKSLHPLLIFFIFEPPYLALTYRDPELTSSEGGQDTSACTISGHFLHVFSGKCPETLNLTRFTKSK